MGTRLIKILVLLLCILTGGFASAEARAKAFTVVIDAGHGGKDYGCIGNITNEKTIVLDVAKQVGDLIKSNHPDVKVIYTRSDDRFIELSERAAIAYRAHADLFISIHVNSVDKKTRGREKIHGASVYTLGLHRTDDNLAVAMRENSVIELEKDYSETYQGFDPNSSESYIIFELTQNRHQLSSIELAEAINNQLVSTASRADKGVRQAGFLVLRATSMPAVLVELDFICNPEAERFLDSADGRAKCALSISNAFTTYYNHHKGTGSAQATQPATTTGANGFVAQGNAAVTYSIQFLTSPTQLQAGDSRLNNIDDATFYLQDNTYKYICGEYKSLNEAKRRLRTIKKTYPEAFIIKMRAGVRVQ